MASSSGSPKFCFNSACKQALEVPRQGWLCRTGDFADLCDRCSSAFKDGNFCDTYHSNASGWRCCESCGKQIHCGCIASFHTFILLDAGGIECLNCAKTEYILTPNPTWPSSSHILYGPPERTRDVSSKNWRYISGSGPVPWRQAPSLFNSFNAQHDLQLASYSLGQCTTDDPCEKLMNDSWRIHAPELINNRVDTTGKIVSCKQLLASLNPPSCSGIQYDEKHNLFKEDSFQSFFHAKATPLFGLTETFVAHDQKSEKGKVAELHVQRLCPPPSVKQCSNSNGAGPSLESQAHNARDRGETRAHHQQFHRHWPQFTAQEIQQLSGGSSAKITPLFEKVLSASDAGKIGRLVLPKKCAELYLPPLSEPEGYPLVIQDLTGKDWVLQYRFWPNNNSRMYVLEGVTPCIQSMKLQAGDTVTFSRLEPSGKLIMGFRKASLISSSHNGNETRNTWVSTHKESSNDSKRKKGVTLCSNSEHLKFKKEEILQLSVTLEQVQGLLRPPLTNPPNAVLIDGVEFEDFQEAPIIGSPTEFAIANVGSTCSMEAESKREHLEHTPPMINHENLESLDTVKGLCADAELANHDEKATTRHPCHKHGCTCVACILAPGGSKHKSTQSLYGDNVNAGHKTPVGQRIENDPNREKSSNPSFKSQIIDLNIQPEGEEEPYPVSDSMGIMSLVEESTQRYRKQLKQLSINGISDGNHKNHDL